MFCFRSSCCASTSSEHRRRERGTWPPAPSSASPSLSSTCSSSSEVTFGNVSKESVQSRLVIFVKIVRFVHNTSLSSIGLMDRIISYFLFATKKLLWTQRHQFKNLTLIILNWRFASCTFLNSCNSDLWNHIRNLFEIVVVVVLLHIIGVIKFIELFTEKHST